MTKKMLVRADPDRSAAHLPLKELIRHQTQVFQGGQHGVLPLIQLRI
jgi:hypothetical protein